MKICYFGTYDKFYTSNKLILDGLRQNGAEVLEVNAHIRVTRLDSQKDMGLWPLFKRIIKKYRIFVETAKHFNSIRRCDAIYVGYPGHIDVLLAVILGKLLHIPVMFNPLVVLYTGFTEEQRILRKDSFLGRLAKWGEGRIYNWCDLVFADTPLQVTLLKDLFKVPEEKIRVLLIGADDKFYTYTPYTNTSKKMNVCYYGLYSPIHGVDYIIECARLLKNDPDITFSMIGIGQTFEKNYKRAQELKLKNITFFHETPEHEHPGIMAKSDVFLGFLEDHPSVVRVVPNKVYQGVAMGKVVITAKSPAIESVFTDKENIYLCKPKDAKELSEILVTLKKDPTLRKSIADNGYKLFVEKLNPKAIGRELMTHVREVLNIKK